MGESDEPNGRLPDPFADVLAANIDYSAEFAGQQLTGRAARGLAVVTCMDSRIAPLEMLGLRAGDAKILRNAGGRVTDEVLRTLVIAVQLLGVDRVMVIGHTDCRMTKSTDEQIHAELSRRGIDTRSLDFGTIADQWATLQRDVQRVRSCPYLPADLAVAGYVYDTATGRLDAAAPVQ